MKASLIILFILLSTVLSGQQLLIEGRILDKDRKEPVAYAGIYNKSLHKGTISNTDGYFRIPANGLNDSVFVSCVGFIKQRIPLTAENNFYTVSLEVSVQLLSMVVIKAPDDAWLRELLVECREMAPGSTTEAKAYYELKSFVQDRQIELVESFFNLRMTGYDLMTPDLKAGRLALQPYNNRLFTSRAGSRAITLLRMFGDNPYFPQSPLDLSAGKMGKRFFLELNKKYRDDNLDSVYVIGFTPKDTTGLYFGGQIWVNKTGKQIIRINLQCKHAQRHPFLPLFSIDRIKNVDFNITKTFSRLNGKTRLNHIRFTYNIDYISRAGNEDEYQFRVATSAVIYAFDYDQLFTIPRFPFKDEKIDDYKKISALPYNAFFWRYYNDYRLSDRKNLNEQFFSDTATITNMKLFAQHQLFSLGYFENAFIPWSPERILFKENVPVPGNKRIGELNFPADQYNLAVKIFMDINANADSTNILTATILDPMESFYLFPPDNVAHCFINIYFDLVEIERRKFEQALEISDKTNATAQKMYDELLVRIEALKQQYMKEVERGSRKEQLLKWNNIVIKNLGIDNVAFFHLNEEME